MNLSICFGNLEKILNRSSFLIKSDEVKNVSIDILNDDEEDVIQNKKIVMAKKTKSENDLLENYEKFLEFLSKIKEEIQNQFKNNYNLFIKLKFSKEEDINYNSNSLYNITCRYYFFPLNEETISYFVDENILVNRNYKNILVTERNINNILVTYFFF